MKIFKNAKNELKKLDISSLDIQILSPYEATVFTLKKIKKGKNQDFMTSTQMLS